MNKIPARTLDFYDRHITQAMIEKYGFSELEAMGRPQPNAVYF